MTTSVKRTTVEIAISDSPGATVLVILTVDLGSKYPSLTTVKSALELLDDYVQSEVIIDRPHSDYDCTGKAFTSSIERIKRFTTRGMGDDTYTEVEMIVAIYKHEIRVDV